VGVSSGEKLGMKRRIEILGVGVDVVTADEAVRQLTSFWQEEGASAAVHAGRCEPSASAAHEQSAGRTCGRSARDPGEQSVRDAGEQSCAAFKTHQVVTLNPEMIMAAQHDGELRRALEESSLVVADGIGVVWASRVLRQPLPERIAGIDLAVAVLQVAAAQGRAVFFLGGEEGVAERAAERLCRRFPGLRVAGVHHGYFTEAENHRIVRMIAEKAPDLLLVGLGAPKQELWIYRNLGFLGARVAMGVGGALDVFAGRVKRAPVAWQKLGLEWAYRLIQQPWRFRRMLALPKFAAAVLRRRWLGQAAGNDGSER